VLRGAIVSRNTRVGTNASFRYPKGDEGYGAVPNVIRRRVSDRDLARWFRYQPVAEPAPQSLVSVAAPPAPLSEPRRRRAAHS